VKCEIITLRLQHNLATSGTSCLTALADTSTWKRFHQLSLSLAHGKVRTHFRQCKVDAQRSVDRLSDPFEQECGCKQSAVLQVGLLGAVDQVDR